MAGMFYSLEETAEKLRRTPDEIKQMVREGKLREFRDGAKQLFKAEEIDKLAEDTLPLNFDANEQPSEQAEQQTEEPIDISNSDFDIAFDETGEITLLPEDDQQDDTEQPPSQIELTEEEPAVDESSEDDLIELADETEELAQTAPAEEQQQAEEEKTEETDEIQLLDDEPEPEPGPDLSSEIKLESSETGDLTLEPEASDNQKPSTSDEFDIGELSSADLNLGELTGADTNIGTTGINVLGDTDDEYKLADDTKAETKFSMGDDEDEGGDLGDLDDDLNMDSVGSGSGLLDLSLQADDTSLGAVLDDILPGGEAEAPAPDMDIDGGLDDGVAIDEPETLITPGPIASDEPVLQTMAASPASMATVVELPPDAGSNLAGISTFLPLIALIFSAVILFAAAVMEITPSLLKMVTSPMGPLSMIWYIVFGLMLLSVILGLVSFSGSGEPKTKKAKKEKPKKVKPKKEKKKKK